MCEKFSMMFARPASAGRLRFRIGERLIGAKRKAGSRQINDLTSTPVRTRGAPFAAASRRDCPGSAATGMPDREKSTRWHERPLRSGDGGGPQPQPNG
jgi:hypothetical protein